MLRELRYGPRFLADHRFTMKRGGDYVDGELDPAGRRRIERHASLCPGCREALRSLRRTLSALRGLRRDEAPDDAIAGAVLARWRDERGRDAGPP